MVARYRSAFSFWQFIAMLLFVIVLPSGERFEPFKSIYLVSPLGWFCGPRFEKRIAKPFFELNLSLF